MDERPASPSEPHARPSGSVPPGAPDVLSDVLRSVRLTGAVYLALWRMQLASRRLLEGGAVAGVAAAVGYESEAAFSRAFKKLVGESPATWRRAAATSFRSA